MFEVQISVNTVHIMIWYILFFSKNYTFNFQTVSLLRIVFLIYYVNHFSLSYDTFQTKERSNE